MTIRFTDEELKSLYHEFETPQNVIGHCRGVTDCALKIAEELNKKGKNLDLDLIYNAGIVHDMARVMDEHWNVAADKLASMGRNAEADIVRVHMKPDYYNDFEALDEKDMVLIGDRLVKESNYVGLDERFDYIIAKARRYGHVDEDRILRNKAKLKALLQEIESYIGKSIDSLFEKKID